MGTGTIVVVELVREQGRHQVVSREGADRLHTAVHKTGKTAVDSVEVTDKRIPPKVKEEMEHLLGLFKVDSKWVKHVMARD
jgi:hypothetical protein